MSWAAPSLTISSSNCISDALGEPVIQLTVSTMILRKLANLQVLPRLRGYYAAPQNLPFCLAAGLILFVFSLARYWIGYDPTSIIGPDFSETWHLADNLRTNGHFANPFGPLDTGPSAHLAPAFPVFLALLTSLFGVHSVGAFAYKFTAVLAVSFLLALLPLVGRLLGMGVLTGVLAACIWLAAKPPLFPAWEAHYAGLLIAIASCCFRRLIGSTAPHLGVTLMLGFLVGLLTLLSPTCIPVFLCWLFWLGLSRKASLFRAPAVALIILPTMMVSPWIVRNYLVFDRIILVRDNLGLELSVSNNDCAAFGVRVQIDSGCFQKVHPNGNMVEAAKVLAMGEARYNELRLHEAGHWITGNSHRFMSLCIQRLVAFWLPHDSENLSREIFQPGRRAERYSIYLMTFLSIVGLWVTARRDVKSATVCSIWLWVYPTIYYFVQFEDRYRYPIMWVTFLLGAVPLSIVIEWLWNLSIRRAIDIVDGNTIETDRARGRQNIASRRNYIIRSAEDQTDRTEAPHRPCKRIQ